MLPGIKKPTNPRRPVVSKSSEEKLVRDKCGNCKKLFLAFRPDNHPDLKTCDDCLNSRKLSESALDNNVPKIEKSFSEPELQSRESHENLTPRLCNRTEFPVPENELKVDITENSCEENEITILPSRLGSYSVRHKIHHGGYFLCIGDIVSLRSEGVDYYAQITIFVESVFCEKYAALIWLLPTTLRSSAAVGFDPYSFTYGPEDECFYNVDQLKFVMHPPTRFYKRFIPPVPINNDTLFGSKHKYKVHCKRKS